MSMRAVAISALLITAPALAGCPKSKPDGTTPDDRPARKEVLSWGTTPLAPNGDVPRVDVFLAVTDETGKSVSYPLGTYDGACTEIGPLAEYRAITAMSCTHNGAGFQIQISSSRTEIIAAKVPISGTTAPDPMALQQITSIPIPLGAAVSVKTP
jgi:hypothetical protein